MADLPGDLEGMLQLAEQVDPKSWRRNDVEARVLNAAGEVDRDQARKVTAELAAWMQANSKAIAEWSRPDAAE